MFDFFSFYFKSLLFLDLSFHQKVPKECPALELKATHGLVTPEEFIIPPIHELWTPVSYSAFDLSRNINPKDAANSVLT
jgi:hypothetical protein